MSASGTECAITALNRGLTRRGDGDPPRHVAMPTGTPYDVTVICLSPSVKQWRVLGWVVPGVVKAPYRGLEPFVRVPQCFWGHRWVRNGCLVVLRGCEGSGVHDSVAGVGRRQRGRRVPRPVRDVPLDETALLEPSVNEEASELLRRMLDLESSFRTCSTLRRSCLTADAAGTTSGGPAPRSSPRTRSG